MWCGLFVVVVLAVFVLLGLPLVFKGLNNNGLNDWCSLLLLFCAVFIWGAFSSWRHTSNKVIVR